MDADDLLPTMATKKPSDILCRVREARIARGFSQGDLAQKVGITRQSIVSIENGAYVPNTAVALRLGQILEKRVEELFTIPDALPTEPVQIWGDATGSQGRLSLARVRGRLVAHPLTAGKMCLEGFTSSAGLLSDEAGRHSARILMEPEKLDRTVLLMGCDPSLGIVSDHLCLRNPDYRLSCLPVSSRAALEALSHGVTHMAGSHLKDPRSGECNLSPARQALRATGGSVVCFASWEQGFVVARGNPLGIRACEDLARPDVRFINREPGAGSRATLDDMLSVDGVPASQVAGYERIVHTHFGVGRTVAAGGADVGISLRATAHAFDLDFIPLSEVRFDLVIATDQMDHPVVAEVLNLLHSRSLRADLAALPGYDVTRMGDIVARLDPD